MPATESLVAPALKHARLLRQDAYINGQWQAGANRFAVRNPADGSLVAQVTNATSEDAEQAIAAAQAAFPAWAAKTGPERAAILRRWYELILEHADDLALLLTFEQGKPLAQARGEVTYGAGFIEWFAEEAKRINGDVLTPSTSDKRMLVIKQAIGVCAAITPWNFPIAMITRKVAPALAAGCSIVIKPAEQTPLCALALAQLAQEAGFPAGVINVLAADADSSVDVGAALCASPVVRHLSFTGSTEVGRILMQQCAPTIKKLSLELGGQAPFIVFDDADLDAAVEGAMRSKYRNSGQTCVCANRFYAHTSIYNEFVARLTKASAALKWGNGQDPDVDLGPLIEPSALEKVERHVADALEKGATLETGGKRDHNGGRFYLPTVLSGVRNDMLITREETFGPVAAVLSFESDEEVIAAANDTEFGLAAYFYARDIGRVWRVAEQLEYGMVGINTGAISNRSAPFGGVKQSGLGREGSKYGIEEYLEMKYLCMGGL